MPFSPSSRANIMSHSSGILPPPRSISFRGSSLAVNGIVFSRADPWTKCTVTFSQRE